AEDLDAVGAAANQAGAAQRRFVDGCPVIEALQIGNFHDDVFFLEDVREAALGQTAMQRHLAAFESAHTAEAGARLLALFTAAGGLAVARSGAAADALLRVSGAFLRFEIAEFHRLLHYLNEMRNLGDHPAHFFRVQPLGNPVHLAEAERFEGLAHFARASDAAANLLHAQRFFLFRFLRAHASPPSLSPPLRPRRFLYSLSLRSCLSASNVALTTLCGFAVPRDLVRMFWMPADSRIARTGPPAMTPVPSDAGLRRTFPAP